MGVRHIQNALPLRNKGYGDLTALKKCVWDEMLVFQWPKWVVDMC